MDAIDSVVDLLREFSKDSIRLVKRCHNPDRKELYTVRNDGIRWVLREADLHPHQQHHCWI